MKTNIKIVFKDNTDCVFDANGFDFEEDRGSLVAYILTSEIKYLMFVEVEE